MVLRSVLAAAAASAVSFSAGAAYADGMPDSGGTPGAPLTVSEYIGVADWSGFYVGGQVGGAWSTTDWQQSTATTSIQLEPLLSAPARASTPMGRSGYPRRLQSTDRLLGVRPGAGRQLDRSRPGSREPVLSRTRRIHRREFVIGSITGRIGYTWDRWQWYAKGGWAYGNADMTLNDQVNGIVASDNSWANGWIIGGGVEYFLWPSISLGLTYDYIDLDLKGEGDLLSCAGCGALVPGLDSDIITQSVMARMSFYLTPEDEPASPGYATSRASRARVCCRLPPSRKNERRGGTLVFRHRLDRQPEAHGGNSPVSVIATSAIQTTITAFAKAGSKRSRPRPA